MTKQIFADFFKNAIPVLGGVIGGGVTYAIFKPCCVRLKNVLRDTALSNPDHISDRKETLFADNISAGIEVIDVEYTEEPVFENFTKEELESELEELKTLSQMPECTDEAPLSQDAE